MNHEETGLYHTIFGSIVAPVNMLNARHDGESAFGTNTVIVLCANSEVRDRILESLEQAGYPESMVNVMEIPADVYRMGLERGKDTFNLFGRISQPEERDGSFLRLKAEPAETVPERLKYSSERRKTDESKFL